MMPIAVFPGSFDPFTKGHYTLIERAAPLFSKIIIAIGNNTSKNSLFTIEQRVDIAQRSVADFKNVSCIPFQGLTVDLCKRENATFIIRGVRNTIDFEYEKSIALMNKQMTPEIETILLFASPNEGQISSTILREIHKSGGDISQFLANGISI
jgi:pantetheine-phosphate adenylyltransferase